MGSQQVPCQTRANCPSKKWRKHASNQTTWTSETFFPSQTILCAWCFRRAAYQLSGTTLFVPKVFRNSSPHCPYGMAIINRRAKQELCGMIMNELFWPHDFPVWYHVLYDKLPFMIFFLCLFHCLLLSPRLTNIMISYWFSLLEGW